MSDGKRYDNTLDQDQRNHSPPPEPIEAEARDEGPA